MTILGFHMTSQKFKLKKKLLILLRFYLHDVYYIKLAENKHSYKCLLRMPVLGYVIVYV